MARTVDVDKKHLSAMLRAAAAHEGAAFIEIYQNCPVFNDGAFESLRGKSGTANQVRLEHGQPIRFGDELEHGVIRNAEGSLEIARVGDVGEDALVVHDAHRRDPSLAFALAHLSERPTAPTPIGVLRDVERPAYGVGSAAELEQAHSAATLDDVDALLHAGDTWTVS